MADIAAGEKANKGSSAFPRLLCVWATAAYPGGGSSSQKYLPDFPKGMSLS